MWGHCSAHMALGYVCPAPSLPQELTNSCVLEVVCRWAADGENWAAAVSTCPATMPAPETTLRGGWPNLWPQGVREEPRGWGELNDKPLCCASPGAELCHQNPALSTARPSGHPFLPLEKPGESRRCQPPSAQPPRCSSISAQLHGGGSRATLASL